jgi:hypothetical protein
MKFLKKFTDFKENAAASASSTAGMGAVSAAQPGSFAGTTGTTGSGDIGFTFKKEKRKKGDPTKVTDMRDLAPAKGITKIKESNSESKDPNQNPEVKRVISDCVVELSPDSDFELTMMKYDKDREFVDLGDDDSDGGYIDYEELRISFHKMISRYLTKHIWLVNWTGNYSIRCRFDKDGETSREITTLRGRGSEMTGEEQKLFDIVDDVANKLINSLDYQYGFFTIEWIVAGSGMPYNSNRDININASFVLYNNLKN